MKKSTSKKVKYLAGGGLILIFTLVILSTTAGGKSGFINPYKSVSEIANNPDEYRDERVQAQGVVVEGTVEWVPRNLNFTLTDGKARMDVVYEGVIPATFPLGKELDPNSKIEVVAIGVYDGEKVRAEKLLVKCPSKYETKM